MSLKKREEELYHRDHRDHIEESSETAPQRSRKISAEEPLPRGKEWGTVEASSQLPASKSRWILRLAIATAITIGLFTAGWYGLMHWQRDPGIAVLIEGESHVHAGNKYSFKIAAQNPTHGALEQVSLTIRAGSGVLFAGEDGQLLGERVVRRTLNQGVPPNTITREAFAAYFLGKEGEERQIEITFRYRMANLESDFEITEVKKVTIASPAVTLLLDLPRQALALRDFRLNYEWKNISDLDPLQSLTSELAIPADFTITEISPAPTENTKWVIDKLPSQKSGSVTILGSLQADPGEAHAFRATLYAEVWGEKILLAETRSEVLMIENPLLLAISVNGATEYNADPGENLTYRVTFKNNFREALRDIIIIAQMPSELLDATTLRTAGAFDSRTRTVRFHGGNTPQLLMLGPGESGSVTFEVAVRRDIPRDTINPVIEVNAEMTSATIPRHLGEEEPVRADIRIQSKVNGLITLTPHVLLRDPIYGGGAIGPWPLHAEETTQMSVRLRVNANINNFENITISTTLPGNVRYIGNVRGDTTGTEVIFNPRTSFLEWKIPNIAANQQKTLIFQIAVTPSVADIGDIIPILEPATMHAEDSFTTKPQEIRTHLINSDNIHDRSIDEPLRDGRVRE